MQSVSATMPVGLAVTRAFPVRLASSSRAAPRAARMVAARAEANDEVAAASTVVSEPQTLRELNQDIYYEYINGDESADVVVVDCYTDFCGPCKMIKPKLVELDAEMDEIDIVGFNCNARNKDLGQKLGISAVPHFFIYAKGELVDEMTGANYGKLKEKIDDAVAGL